MYSTTRGNFDFVLSCFLGWFFKNVFETPCLKCIYEAIFRAEMTTKNIQNKCKSFYFCVTFIVCPSNFAHYQRWLYFNKSFLSQNFFSHINLFRSYATGHGILCLFLMTISFNMVNRKLASFSWKFLWFILNKHHLGVLVKADPPPDTRIHMMVIGPWNLHFSESTGWFGNCQSEKHYPEWINLVESELSLILNMYMRSNKWLSAWCISEGLF